MRHATPLRVLAVAIVVVLLLSALFVAAEEDSPALPQAHTCGYEYVTRYHNTTPTGVILSHEDAETGAVVYEGVSRSSSGNYETIRIGVFLNDLNDSSRYCTSAGGTAPDFQGNTASCSSDTVLTEEKKNVLKTKLIPEAIQLHSDRLKVVPLTSPIVVPSSVNSVCDNFSVPSSHKTTGVSDYDFVIYIAAGPTSDNTIAWATTCSYLTDSKGTVGRPLVGVANISPEYISTAHATVRVVAHEILHALGFTSTFFKGSGIYSSATVRQKTDVPVITSSKVVSAAKDHYECDSLTNMELEDGGGPGMVGHHWKRRNAKDELMAGASSHGFYTAMTIAAMEDLGYYQGDYSKAEIMPWGLKAGCKLITDMCMTNSVSIDESMFCAGGAYICTSDRDAVGACYTTSASLPSWASSYGVFNDDATMDYCPHVIPYTRTSCTNGQVDYAPDSKFGDSSRCLDVSTDRAVCAAIHCTDSTYTVQFRSGDSIACTPGRTVKIPKTKRTATCAPYIEVCDGPSKDGAAVMATIGCSSVLVVLLGVLLSMLV